jgi:penicillin-binding protein 1A
MDYERRHGYRGPEGFVDLPPNQDDRDERSTMRCRSPR